MELFQIYNNVKIPPPNRRMKSKYMLFQDALRHISKWTTNDIDNLYTRVVKQPKRFKGCMESLYYSHMNSFSSFYNTSRKVSVQIPTPRVFLHQVLLQVARFLFIDPKKITQGINVFKPLVLDALDIVVMTSIPVDTFVDTKAQELKEHTLEAERMDLETKRLEEERKIEERISAETQRLLQEQNRRTQEAEAPKELQVDMPKDMPQVEIPHQSIAASISDAIPSLNGLDNGDMADDEELSNDQVPDVPDVPDIPDPNPLEPLDKADPMDNASMLKAPTVDDDITSTMSDIPRNAQIPASQLL